MVTGPAVSSIGKNHSAVAIIPMATTSKRTLRHVVGQSRIIVRRTLTIVTG